MKKGTHTSNKKKKGNKIMCRGPVTPLHVQHGVCFSGGEKKPRSKQIQSLFVPLLPQRTTTKCSFTSLTRYLNRQVGA